MTDLPLQRMKLSFSLGKLCDSVRVRRKSNWRRIICAGEIDYKGFITELAGHVVHVYREGLHENCNYLTSHLTTPNISLANYTGNEQY